jgi:hypothetical protein
MTMADKCRPPSIAADAIIDTANKAQQLLFDEGGRGC